MNLIEIQKGPAMDKYLKHWNFIQSSCILSSAEVVHVLQNTGLFFIDFPYAERQHVQLENCLANHFTGSWLVGWLESNTAIST